MDLNSFLFSFWIKLICSCHQLVTFIDDNVFLFSLNLFFHKLTIYSEWQYLGLVNIKFLLDVKASFTIICEHFIGWHRFQHLMGSRFYAIFYQGRTSFTTFCYFFFFFVFFLHRMHFWKIVYSEGKEFAHSDLSRRWSHMSYCRFSRALTQMHLQ